MTARKKVVVKVDEKGLQPYELVFVVKPEATDESLENTINAVSGFITSKEGVVSDMQRWGKKKMSYPISHILEGNYVLAKFQLSSKRCKELEANLKISEEILRHMLVKVK
jgi:small subunit ribosomal protein S6